MVDTGTSMMAMPKEYFEKLSDRWARSINNQTDFKCQDGLCIGNHQCSYYYDILGNITVQLQDRGFDLMPKSYLLNGQDLDVQFMNTCIFGVMPLPSMVGSI